MEYRRLGETEIDVSVYSLGCWPFAGGVVWGDQDDNDSIAAVGAALEAGITCFDTAEGYESGRSERVLGKALGSRRSNAVIATKVSPNHLTTVDVASACERSLTNLGTDYIDLYQIHWPNHDIPISETVRALEDLKSSGKVRAIGVSNFGVLDLTEMVGLTTCASNQIPYSLLWRVIEHEVRPVCVANDVGIICYTPLSQGLLTGRYKTAWDVPDGLARTRHYSSNRPLAKHGESGCEEEVFAAIAKIQAISDEIGQPMASVALAWLRQQKGVSTILVGARNKAEVGMNLPALELKLSDEIVNRLDIASDPVKERLGTNVDGWNVPSRYR